MRIVFCWSNLSGYMAACWRELSRREGIDLHVVAFDPSRNAKKAPFDGRVLEGVHHTFLEPARMQDGAYVTALLKSLQPEAIAVAGWIHKPYSEAFNHPDLQQIPVTMGLDMPWLGKARQYAARWALRNYLSRISHVMVPGERAWQYARHLGFREDQISRGQYGVDVNALKPLHAKRQSNPAGWPKAFIYVGRYNPVKGIVDLVEAYKIYRTKSDTPWPLRCCGTGEQADLLADVKGIENLGFTQPDALPQTLAEHGVYVMPSRYDPWPLALVEACASGLPIICTQACGSAIENVRPYYNGIMVPTAQPERMANAMLWMQKHHEDLSTMGARSQQMAQAYSPEAWADRWIPVLTGTL